MRINGINYHVVETGLSAEKKPTVLFLHGFTGTSETYSDWMENWKADYHCLSLDIIGHGKTDAPIKSSRYQMEQITRDIQQLLVAKEITEVTLIGYSMGGRVAISFASRYPAFVDAMVLINSSPGLANDDARAERRAADEKLAIWLKKVGIKQFVDYWENLPLFASQKSLPKEKQLATRKTRLAQREIGLANSLIGMGTGAQTSYWKSLSGFQFPVLLITSEFDSKFKKIATQMLEQLPNAKIIEIKDAGHAAYLEQPKLIQETINHWLLSQLGGK